MWFIQHVRTGCPLLDFGTDTVSEFYLKADALRVIRLLRSVMPNEQYRIVAKD